MAGWRGHTGSSVPYTSSSSYPQEYGECSDYTISDDSYASSSSYPVPNTDEFSAASHYPTPLSYPPNSSYPVQPLLEEGESSGYSESYDPSSSYQVPQPGYFSSPITRQPAYYTSAFNAETMAEVPTKPTKKMDKAKREAVRNNRKQTCEMHRRQKKECNPDRCPGNKIFQRRQMGQAESERAGTEQFPRLNLYNTGYGDDFEAISRVDHPSGTAFLENEEEENPDLVWDYVATSNGPAADNPGVKSEAEKEKTQSNDQITAAQDVSTSEEATEEDMRLWTMHDEQYYNSTPRSVPGGVARIHIGFGQVNPTTNFEFAAGSLALFDGSADLQGGQTPEGIKTAYGRDGGADGDGGQNGAPWDRYKEYGDYFKGHDQDSKDGLPPNGDSNRGTGGGFSKPDGGYYSLSSGFDLEEAVSKLSLE